MNIVWDANNYKDNFSFVHKYGNDLLSLIDTEKTVTAVDLGCGNGALTKGLSEMGIDVIGMDSSEEMLEVARSLYPELRFMAGDACDFRLGEPVDLIFSNAVLHWIDKEKHPDMLKNLAGNLKPDGELIIEMGGRGNNGLIHEALEAECTGRGIGYVMPFYFPSVGEYAPLIEAAGLTVSSARLFERPTELKGENGLEDWIRMFVKKPFENVGDEQKDEIIRDAVDSLRPLLFREGKWYADYVRLRMVAVKRKNITSWVW